jgi:tetratricopeptide (TPR) repeat protein
MASLVSAFLFVAAPAADQNDSQLNSLFSQLLEAKSVGEARPIEISIWEVWTRTDDQVVTQLMNEAASAMSRQDYDRALRYLDQVVEIAPDYAEGWNRRATVNYMAQYHEDSLRDIERTLSLEPRHFGALSGRGLVLLALERVEEALRSFEEALAIHPHLVGAQINADALREVLQRQEI